MRYVQITSSVTYKGTPLRGLYGVMTRPARMPRGLHTDVDIRLPTVTDSLLRFKRGQVTDANQTIAEEWIKRGGNLNYDPALGVLPLFSDKKRSKAEQAVWMRQAEAQVAMIKKIREEIGFSPSTRGWCYLAEEYFKLPKGDFDKFQALLVTYRKEGLLPLDIVAEDETRAWASVECIDEDDITHAQKVVRKLNETVDAYSPISFWDDKPVYLQLWVEKIDLREMWKHIAAWYRIPIANAKGWSDLHCRAAMLKRFKQHARAGRKPVLLYCGDHDPVGLNMSECMMDNLVDMQHAVDWNPRGKLKIDRFGLNYDFIEEHRLSWINNLESGSGKNLASPSHPDHAKAHVQQYLRKFGARKVEANALVVKPEVGKKLLLDTIAKYLDPNAPYAYEEIRRPHVTRLRNTLADMLLDW